MGPFAEAIAAAMQAEWGATPSARKEVGRITNANERAVRNWFEGKNGPSGENLVLLMRHSDAVLETVLELADRRALVSAVGMLGLRDRLKEVVDAIDGLRPS
ncbi:MAG: hypothetical protein ACXWKX_08385 [Caulobacteraceae bacterium]